MFNSREIFGTQMQVVQGWYGKGKGKSAGFKSYAGFKLMIPRLVEWHATALLHRVIHGKMANQMFLGEKKKKIEIEL